MKRCKVVAVGAAAALVLTACGSSKDSSTQVTSSASTVPASALASSSSVGASASVTPSPTPTPTSTPTPTPHKPDATKADLRSMEIPDECQVPAGSRLTRGKYEDEEHRNSRLVGDPVAVDVDGDGSKEMASFFNCDLGGHAWPDQLVVVGRGGKLIAWESLSVLDNDAGAQGGIQGKTVTAQGQKIGYVIDAKGKERSGAARVSNTRILFDKDPNRPKGKWAEAAFTTEGYGPAKVGARISDIPGARSNECSVLIPGKPEGLIVIPDKSQKVIEQVGVEQETSDDGYSVYKDYYNSLRSRSGVHLETPTARLKRTYGSSLKSAEVSVQSPDLAFSLSHNGHSLAFVVGYSDGYREGDSVNSIWAFNGAPGHVEICQYNYDYDKEKFIDLQ